MNINFDKNPLDDIMSTDQASQLWGSSPDHIKHLCQQGKIEAKKIGNSWVVRVSQPNPLRQTKLDLKEKEENRR